MNLLVAAHKAEVNTLINKLNLHKMEHLDNLVYGNENTALLITGEGIENVFLKLTSHLTIHSKEIKKIVNLGIAGAVSHKLKKNRIYEIGTVAFESGANKMPPQALSTKMNTLFCQTRTTALHNNAHLASTPVDVVDMELWAIASVARYFKIPCCSYKLISDYVSEPLDFNEIKKNMHFYSNEISTFYINKERNDLV